MNNDTPADAMIDSIVQDICELDNNPFDGMGDDDVWCSLSDLRVILERNFEDHRTASLAAQDGLVEALAGLTFLLNLERNTQAGESVMVNINLLRKLDAALSAIKGDKS